MKLAGTHGCELDALRGVKGNVAGVGVDFAAARYDVAGADRHVAIADQVRELFGDVETAEVLVVTGDAAAQEQERGLAAAELLSRLFVRARNLVDAVLNITA